MPTSAGPLSVPNTNLTLTRGVVPPPATGDPLVRFDIANGDTLSSPSINQIGFYFPSTSRTIEAAPNGQLGMRFGYIGGLSPDSWNGSNNWKEQRYQIGTPLFENYERIVLWIPSNFEHRKLVRLNLDVGQDASSWVHGDVITGANGSSQGIFHYADSTYLWLRYAEFFYSDGSWVGTVTNSARSSSVVTTGRDFAKPGSNNKFSAQWNETDGNTYSTNGSIFEYDTGASDLVSEDSFFTCKHTAADGSSSGNGGPDSSGTTGNRGSVTAVPPGIDISTDLGALHDFVIRRRRSSSLTASDGIAQIWKNGVLVYEDLAVPLFSAVTNAYTEGYLLGYVNSGFDVNTTFYITKYELYDSTRPEGIPAA